MNYQIKNKIVQFLLAASIKKMYPTTRLGSNKISNNMFYYEFLFTKNISTDNFKKIKLQMLEFASKQFKLVINTEIYKLKNEDYRNSLIQSNKVVFLDLIDNRNNNVIFTDFILVDNNKFNLISNIKFFELVSLGGAYWMGDANNPQFTRIHGIVADSKENLQEKIEFIKNRKLTDHRTLGKNMNLFSFHELSGQGFPNWLKNGMILKNEIQKYIRIMDHKYGFNEVSTSIVGDKRLYETSGHLDHYSDTMFPIINLHGEQLILRPMTCPHHILLYKSQPRYYNEFPIRYSEQSLLYRYEKSGALSGLERVRSMELTEGHVFVRKDQIKSEIQHCYKLIQEVLYKFNIKINGLVLSLRDPKDKEKYYDDDAMWSEAENDLRNVLNEMNVDYVEEKGEAAFYGPKIDIQVLTSMNKEITLSTLQLDFLLPKKFNVQYYNADNSISQPILLHRGLIGTYERFIAILLEQTKGNLPFWLSPNQICIIPINNKIHLEYANIVKNQLISKGIRVYLDNSNERFPKKIMNAHKNKYKYQVLIGDAEISNQNITIREYGQKESKKILLNEFINKVL